jgi:ribose transport system permease protein
MSQSTQATQEFGNVGRPPWWRRGAFASQSAYVLAALVVLVAGIWIVAPVFMTERNLGNIATNFSFIGLMSLGETLVIITGGIDLSVGSVCAMSAVAMMMMMRLLAQTPLAEVPFLTLVLAVLPAVALATLAGWVNGMLVAELRLSPFVTTLGMLSVCRGLTFVLTQGRPQYPTGPDVALFTHLTKGTLLAVPVQLIYLIVAALLVGLVLRHRVWGRHLYAIGGNAKAAGLAGIHVRKITVSVYMASAFFAGVTGVLLAGWLGAAPANLAMGYELHVIAATVIGGANLLGGIGGAVGAVLGSVLIEVVRNGFVLIGANAYWEQVFVGLIIIAAVLVDQVRTRRMTT